MSLGRTRRFVRAFVALAACTPPSGSVEDGSTGATDPAGATVTSGPTGTTETSVESTSSAGTSGESTAASTSTTVGETEGPSISCSIWDDDCPRGEKCMPYADDGGNAWNATRCTPIDPDAVDVGEACTVEGSPVSGIDDCPLHSMCFGVDPATSIGTCRAFCTGTESNPSCADPSEVCQISATSALVLCLPKCDPLEQDCAVAEGCYIGVDGFFVCHPDWSGDAGAAGDACDGRATCDAGLFCATASGVPGCATIGCCSEFCDLGDPTADESCAGFRGGQQCVPAFDLGRAPAEWEHVGLCLIPS